jgi:hypothetical protein
MLLIKILLLAAIAAVLFVLPHHRLKKDYANSGDPLSLAALIGQLGRETTDGSVERRILAVLVMLAIGTVLFAPVLAWEISRNAPPLSDRARTWFITQGIFLLIAAVVTFFAMLLTGWSIGFGGGISSVEPTPILLIVTGLQLLVSAASIVFGAWPAAATMLHHGFAR